MQSRNITIQGGKIGEKGIVDKLREGISHIFICVYIFFETFLPNSRKKYFDQGTPYPSTNQGSGASGVSGASGASGSSSSSGSGGLGPSRGESKFRDMNSLRSRSLGNGGCRSCG